MKIIEITSINLRKTETKLFSLYDSIYFSLFSFDDKNFILFRENKYLKIKYKGLRNKQKGELTFSPAKNSI